MTQPRDKRLADLVVGMRTPLSRVELAATQLARTVMTPAAKELAAGISEAVSHLDERISDVLNALEPAGAEDFDCSTVLAALRQRMEPVLSARSVEWVETSCESEEPVYGDRGIVARSALALLVAGMELAGPRGRLTLDMVSEGAERYGVLLRARSRDATATHSALEGGEADRLLSHARRVAREGGGALEIDPLDSEVVLTLWLSRSGGDH